MEVDDLLQSELPVMGGIQTKLELSFWGFCTKYKLEFCHLYKTC